MYFAVFTIRLVSHKGFYHFYLFIAVLLYDNVDMQQGSSAMLTDITTMSEDTDNQVNRNILYMLVWYCSKVQI